MSNEHAEQIALTLNSDQLTAVQTLLLMPMQVMLESQTAELKEIIDGQEIRLRRMEQRWAKLAGAYAVIAGLCGLAGTAAIEILKRYL